MMIKKNCRFTSMRRQIQRLLTIAMTALMLSACSKGGGTTDGGGGGPHVETPSDITPPVIVINSPSASQVFTSGSTINVTGRLTDNLGLYRGTIRIINDANGFELKSQAYEIHGLRAYDYNISYSTSVTVASDYTIVVSFEDHGNNVTTKSVKVRVNP